jgi:predicted Zn-dependent protease
MLALVLVSGLAAAGCSVNPLSGRPEVMLTSESREREAGEQAAEQVIAEMGLLDDPRLTAYVAAVGRRVAAHAPQRGFDYRFAVIDRDEPNAFALPGGHVYVSRGLLAIANSEDELAVVLAHEVVHVAARHHAQRQTRATGLGLLALPGLLAGSLIGGSLGQLVAAPFALAGSGLLAGYSRDQEREADHAGQELASRAGYDPRALPEFLATLERDDRRRAGSERIPSFFDTHPTAPDRAARATRRASMLSPGPADPIAAGRAGFLKRLDGLLVGEDPAEGVFRGPRFLHPDLGFTVVFPADWKAVNTPRAVGAVTETGDAQVAVQHQGRGDDPREAASLFLEEMSRQTRVEVASLEAERINGLDAVRGRMVAGGRRSATQLDLTWIAHGGFVYLVAGLAEGSQARARLDAVAGVARSFRPLTREERAGIQEHRLGVRPARAGEGLAALGARTGNAWSVEQTAVANALDAGGALAAGVPVKIAVAGPYGGRAAGAAAGAR